MVLSREPWAGVGRLSHGVVAKSFDNRLLAHKLAASPTGVRSEGLSGTRVVRAGNRVNESR